MRLSGFWIYGYGSKSFVDLFAFVRAPSPETISSNFRLIKTVQKTVAKHNRVEMSFLRVPAKNINVKETKHA